MNSENKFSIQFPSYSLAIANFLSSFGGGMILGKAMGLLTHVPFLKGDSLLAYLCGTTLGLLIMKSLGKGRLLSWFTRFSIFSSVSSMFLLGLIFFSYDRIVNGSVESFIFFFILIIRFGFWFLGRVTRVDISSGIGKNLAWTEFSYYLGAIFGLVIWPMWANATLAYFLVVDIIALTIAAGLDRYSFQRVNQVLKAESTRISTGQVPVNVFFGFAGFCVCLTIATQIVEFGFATFSVTFFENGNQFGSNIVAAGYVGAALGAWLLGKTSVEYDLSKKFLGLGLIRFRTISISMIAACLLSFVFLCGAFVIPFYSFPFSQIISLIMFTLSALVYDLVVLVVLDQLGAVAKQRGDGGSVANVYGYIGFFGTLSMLVFAHVLTTQYAFILTSFVFFILGGFFLSWIQRRAPLLRQNS